MGREIRRIPPNWEHPKYSEEDAPFSNRIGQYRPMHNHPFEESASEWLAECLLWSKGEHPDQKDEDENFRKEYLFYWQWAGDPPDAAYYRPKWADGEATWYQVYETVSEGTPVTPPFATKAQLFQYLITKGDFWSQRRGEGPWDAASTAKFLECEWAPSAVGSSQGLKTVNESGFYPE